MYLGHFDSLHIRRLDNNVRSLLQRHGVSLEGEGSGNRGYRSRGSRATAMVGDRFEWPRTNSYSFEEYRRNAGIRDMDEFRADLRRKMSDPRSDSSQNYAGVEHTPGTVPEYNRKPHATMKAAVAAATKLAKGGGRPVVHSVGYSGRIYTRYVDERGFGESLLEEFGSDRYPRPLPRKGGSRATSASNHRLPIERKAEA